MTSSHAPALPELTSTLSLMELQQEGRRSAVAAVAAGPRVHSAFALVKSHVRAQGGRRNSILDVVQRATRELQPDARAEGGEEDEDEEDLEKVLRRVEALRCEMREEVAQLRTDMALALGRLETRVAEAAEPRGLEKGRKPPASGSRRRTLSRTMTAIAPKSRPPPPPVQRSKSEPLGGGAWPPPSKADARATRPGALPQSHGKKAAPKARPGKEAT
ncbi:uncharacterized protein LOC114800140 [Denticeps clupeoides]|uniref:uncharacterized protein LOC114800140 n=1 Tax=Denticeps clupeoides TaxID=299321 RepID=UPI0010A32592|nr:uncharacterized protein LOC114800140 [Denticeps clupeoides]